MFEPFWFKKGTSARRCFSFRGALVLEFGLHAPDLDISRNFVYTNRIMNYSTAQLNRTIMTHQLLSVGMPEYVNPRAMALMQKWPCLTTSSTLSI